MADEQPGESFFVGIADQSVRTHIRNGRYDYIDPDQYECWTEAVEGSRSRAKIYLRRKP